MTKCVTGCGIETGLTREEQLAVIDAMRKDEVRLRSKVANMIVALADEQALMTRSDFQGRSDAVAVELISLIRGV